MVEYSEINKCALEALEFENSKEEKKHSICPICGKNLKYVKSGLGLYYIACPTRSKRHIFEIGPYQTSSKLEQAIKKADLKYIVLTD